MGKQGPEGAALARMANTSIEMMQKPSYVKKLDGGNNIAVLTGAASGGLCSIDLDDDNSVESFLSLNPELATTLRSRGKRGCNFWYAFGAHTRRHQTSSRQTGALGANGDPLASAR